MWLFVVSALATSLCDAASPLPSDGAHPLPYCRRISRFFQNVRTNHHGQSLQLFNIEVLAQIIEVSLALHGTTVFIAVTSVKYKCVCAFVAFSRGPQSDNGALEAGLTGNTPLLHSVESTHETERSDIKNVLSIDFQDKDEIFLCKTDKNTSALYVGFSSSP